MDESKLNQIAKEYGYDLSPAEPQELPKTTLWPITLAFGLIMLCWGFLTSIIFSGIGFIIIAVGLTGWIEEYKDE